MTRAIWIFRVTAVLILLFAAGHTYGFLTLKPPTPEAAAVRAAMDAVHFTVGPRQYSFGGFYVGFGLFVSMSFLLLAWQSFLLSVLVRRNPALVALIGWPMAIFFAGSTVLSVLWFGRIG